MNFVASSRSSKHFQGDFPANFWRLPTSAYSSDLGSRGWLEIEVACWKVGIHSAATMAVASVGAEVGVMVWRLW